MRLSSSSEYPKRFQENGVVIPGWLNKAMSGRLLVDIEIDKACVIADGFYDIINVFKSYWLPLM